MKKKLITGLFLSALTGVASAAGPGFFFPGGARQDSVIHAPTTSLDGKTVTQWGAAIDSNKSAAADAQTTANSAASGVSANATAITNEAERAKAAESTNASAASAAQTTANAAIPLTQKGAASGVAALDESSEVTNPVNTTVSTLSSAVRIHPVSKNTQANSTGTDAIQLGGYSSWYGNDLPLGTYPNSADPTGTTTVADSWVTPPETFHLGGQTSMSSGFEQIHCNPYAGSYAGTCLAVMMGVGNSQAMDPGIGPSPTGIAGYGGFDSAGFVNRIAASTPLYVITSNTATNALPAASDGLDHTPTFTATGATFANPLPSDMSQYIINHPQGIRLLTNEIGCTTCTSLQINTYAGGITGYTLNSDGLVTGVTVANWQVPGSGVTTSGQIPGTSTTDSTTASLDTVWTDFGHPAIMIGIYTDAFNMYSSCSLVGAVPNGTQGDINRPAGYTLNNQLHTCQAWEHDMFNSDTTSGRSHFYGITQVYNSVDGGATPASDSFMFKAAGATTNDFVSSGEYFTIPFSSSSFTVNGYGGPAYASGSQQVVADFNQCDKTAYECDGSNGQYHNRFTIWNTRFQTEASGNSNMYEHETTSFGRQIGGTIGGMHESTMDGVLEEHFELNPGSNQGGINLCYGTETDAECGIITSKYGDLRIRGDLHTGAAKSFYTTDPNGSNASYVFSNAQHQLNIGFSDQTGTSTSLSGAQGDKTLNIIGGLSASDAVTFTSTLGVSGNATLAENLTLSTAGKSLQFDITNPIYIHKDTTSGGLDFTNASYSIPFNFNGTVTALGVTASGSFVIPFGTPSSSTSTCTQGQMEMDATYTYSCVATNTWHRVENGATW